MRRAALLLAAGVLPGCGGQAPPVPQAPARVPAAVVVEPIHFPRYRSPADGGPEEFMQAGIGGVFTLRGRCLGLTEPDGSRFKTVIWTQRASLGRDERGLFVMEGGERFRPGEQVSGGGGGLSGDPIWPLETPYPAECGAEMVQFYGLSRPGRAILQPVPPPPPPPGRP